MVLENKIVQALQYFGHLNKEELTEVLEMIGIFVERRDLDQAISLLKLNGLIREADFDNKRYIALNKD